MSLLTKAAMILAAMGIWMALVLSVALLAKLAVRFYQRKKRGRIIKSELVSLVQRWDTSQPGHVTLCNYWYFDEPAKNWIDPVSGQRLFNGYTDKELTEIASRRKEWGI